MSPADPSQLERLLARLTAQKAWLDWAAGQIARLPGPVLELGLGKGRTYDHLRRQLPSRRILVFDLDLHAPIAVRPAPQDLLLGDFRETLPRARAMLGTDLAALVHADFGSEAVQHDASQALWLGPMIAPLVRLGGLILADRPMPLPGCEPVSGPGETAWRYHGWQARFPL